MPITYSFLIVFTLLSRKSKTEAQTRKLTICLEKVIWLGVNDKTIICSFDIPFFNIKSGILYI